MIYTLEQVSGSGGQDNRRNLAVNVHVMKRLLLCVFSMPLHVRLVEGWARHYFANLDLAGIFLLECTCIYTCTWS